MAQLYHGPLKLLLNIKATQVAQPSLNLAQCYRVCYSGQPLVHIEPGLFFIPAQQRLTSESYIIKGIILSLHPKI